MDTLTKQHSEETNTLREKSDKFEEVAEERRKEMEKLEKTGAELKEQLVQLQVSIWQRPSFCIISVILGPSPVHCIVITK